MSAAPNGKPALHWRGCVSCDWNCDYEVAQVNGLGEDQVNRLGEDQVNGLGEDAFCTCRVRCMKVLQTTNEVKQED